MCRIRVHILLIIICVTYSYHTIYPLQNIRRFSSKLPPISAAPIPNPGNTNELNIDNFVSSIFEDDNTDLDQFEETVIDLSIAKAVKQMIDDKDKEVIEEISPAEKFNQIYNDMKSKNNVTLDSASMLEMLFDGVKPREPFDEVSIRLN